MVEGLCGYSGVIFWPSRHLPSAAGEVATSAPDVPCLKILAGLCVWTTVNLFSKSYLTVLFGRQASRHREEILGTNLLGVRTTPIEKILAPVKFNCPVLHNIACP